MNKQPQENRHQIPQKQPDSHQTCLVRHKCSGCQLQNMDYARQLSWKQSQVVRLLGRFCRVDQIVGMQSPLHYRNKVQAAFLTGRSGQVISGVYQSGTRRVVPVASCMIEDRKASDIIHSVRHLMQEMRIAPYNPSARRGLVRHVLVRRGFSSGQIMVVLVTASPIFPEKKRFTAALLKLHPDITTIVHNINRDYDGLMLGETEHVLYGEGFIEDTLCGLRFRISAKSFYQVNPVQTARLYACAMEYAALDADKTALDAYCGIGTIGLIAAQTAGRVVGVESVREAVRDAIANARLNRTENIWFHQADAGTWMEAAAQECEPFHVVFLDPPRAGCSTRGLHALCALAPERIVYISCNPETQARDLKYLTETGGYQVTAIRPFDLFPYTNHVETCCLLIRKQHIASKTTAVQKNQPEQ